MDAEEDLEELEEVEEEEEELGEGDGDGEDPTEDLDDIQMDGWDPSTMMEPSMNTSDAEVSQEEEGVEGLDEYEDGSDNGIAEEGGTSPSEGQPEMMPGHFMDSLLAGGSGNGHKRNAGEEDDASNDYVDDYTITDGGNEELFEAVGHGDEEKPHLTLTEWKNQCEYQCLECQKMFHDASTCQKHVMDAHKLDTSTYKARHGLSSMMTKEKQYHCFLCNRTVQWCYGGMSQHSKTHKMTMQEMYEKEYGPIGPFPQKRYRGGRPGPASVQKQKVIHYQPLPQPRANSAPKNTSINEIIRTDRDTGSYGKRFLTWKEWKNQCEYQCLECDRNFREVGTSKQHILQKHGMDTMTYKQKHGLKSMMTKEIKYPCAVCGKPVQGCRNGLESHAKMHKLTLEELYQKDLEINGHLPHVEEEESPAPKTYSRPGPKRFKPAGYHAGESSSDLDTSRNMSMNISSSNTSMNISGNTSMNVSGNNIVRKYMGRAPGKQLPYDRWKNRCEFQCYECGKMFHNGSCLQQHLQGALHNMDTSMYKQKNGLTTMMTKVVRYSCIVCQKQVQWTRHSLEQHAKTHGMSLRDLYDREFPEGDHDDSMAASDNSRDMSDLGVKKEASPFVSTDKSADHLTFEKFQNQCDYQCLECGKMYHDVGGIQQHVRASHSMDTATYKAKHGRNKMMTKEVKYTCVVCDRTVQGCRHGLEQHAGTHKMTLHQLYMSEVAAGMPPGEEAGDGNSNHESLVSEVTHEEGTHSPYMNSPRNTPGQPLYNKYGHPNAATGSYDPGFIDWRNKCEYQCLECGKMVNEMTRAIKHVQGKHGLDCKTYKEKHQLTTMMTKEVRYQCGVCNRVVQQCKHGLEQHAKTHMMTLYELYTATHGNSAPGEDHTPASGSASVSLADETDPLDDTNSMDMPDADASGGDIEILDTKGAASTSTPKMAAFSGSPFGSVRSYDDGYGGQKYGDDYTDWHSQCEFACRECGKVFRQPATLQNHIKTQHNMDSEAYKFKHRVRTLMTNEVRKPCPICFREVSWNYFALIGHAKSHATTIRGLYEKDTAANGSANRTQTEQSDADFDPIVEEDDKAAVAEAAEVRMGTIGGGGGGNGFAPQPKPKGLFACHKNKGYSVSTATFQAGSSIGFDDGGDTSWNRTPGPEQDDYTRWHSQCELACRECGKVYSKAKLFKLHLVSRHRMKPDEYKAKHAVTSLMTKKVKITCALCHSDITCNYENLYEHATSKHKMGLKELYEKIKELGNGGDIGGGIDYPSSVQQNQNNNSFGANEHMPFEPTKNRRILPKPGPASSKQNRFRPVDGFPNQDNPKPFMTITEWKNQCEFKCLECGKVFRDASTARKHVFERHKLDTKTYKAKHGLSKMMTKEKTYNCFLCRQTVQWAYGSMFQHSRTHNMTMQEMYEKEFANAANQATASQQGVSDFPDEWEGEQAAEGLVYTDNAEESGGEEYIAPDDHYALNELEQGSLEQEEGEEEQIQTTAADVKNFMQLWGGLLAQNESHNE